MGTALYQPQSGLLTVQYQPDETTRLVENPPRFTWIPAQLEEDCYVLQISEDGQFQAERTLTFAPIPYNFYTPDRVLAPGTYYWRYALWDGGKQQSEWSVARRFVVPEGLPATALPARENRYAQAQEEHPRLWLQGAEEVARFRAKVKADPIGSGWQPFYEKSVLPWTAREPIPGPQPYPNNQRTAPLWRSMYIACQEALYAIRHLSMAGVILEDEALLGKAKAWLLHVAAWDADGATSRDYNDEAAFRIAGALAWGYDWLYGELSEEERDAVRGQLLRRTQQVAVHVIERSKIHQVPYDSHAVRSLSSVLVPCSIAMLHEEPQAREWLDYTMEYYWTLYTPWGGADGGWAEGPHYWTTGMAALLEAIELMKKYTGLSLYDRPFFRKTGDFPLYCYNPNTSTRTSFGDNSTLGEAISTKVGYNIRQYAGVTGNGWYQWYYEKVKDLDTDADSKFYNYGWWDFRFDDLLYLHDYPAVEAVEPKDAEPVKWFRDVGWVAMHHRMEDPDEQIMLLTKASEYGSVSHSHADQGAFHIHAYGEPLAVETGYYVAFNSSMHLRWRRQTVSKNSILIDGKGQFGDIDKALNMAASGRVEEVRREKTYSYVRMNATNAYMENVPYMKRYVREIYFVRNSYFVVVDSVDLSEPGRVNWLFHTLYEMNVKGQTFQVNGRKASMEGRFVFSSSGDLTLSQTDEFVGVDPQEIEGLTRHWHLTATTPQAGSHRIAALLVPKRKAESGKYVSYFVDDQGFGYNLYCTDNGATQKIEIAKAF